MTFEQLATAYLERYVAVERSDTADDFRSGLRVICQTAIQRSTGGSARLGEWRVTDINTDIVERYREARRAAGAGIGGTNRSLSRLRAVFSWAVKVGYCDATPFIAQWSNRGEAVSYGLGFGRIVRQTGSNSSINFGSKYFKRTDSANPETHRNALDELTPL
jgi:hypothetical protein